MNQTYGAESTKIPFSRRMTLHEIWKRLEDSNRIIKKSIKKIRTSSYQASVSGN